MTKKILFFGSQITTGGAQKVLLDQAAWFHNRGYEILVVFYYDKDGVLDEWRQKTQLPIQTLTALPKTAKPASLNYLLRGYIRLKKILHDFQPDVIECFTHDAALLGLTAAQGCKIKGRFAAHHGQFVSLSPLKKWLNAKVVNSKWCSGLVCVSERAKNQALEEGITPAKISVIFNGIQPIEADPLLRTETRNALGVQATDFMILNVGRLVPEKSQHLLISAAAEVFRLRPDCRFFIAGDGPLQAQLSDSIANADIREKFELLGNRADVPALLNAADLFVLYSETEGMPVSLMEAMSLGLPVIASDLEGNRQLVCPTDGEAAGVLIPFGSAEVLAKTILRTIDDESQRKAMTAAAAVRIRDHFSLEQSCRSYERLFFKQSDAGASRITSSSGTEHF